eukprot:PhF_6_TR17338/c0_g1_i1/m.26557
MATCQQALISANHKVCFIFTSLSTTFPHLLTFETQRPVWPISLPLLVEMEDTQEFLKEIVNPEDVDDKKYLAQYLLRLEKNNPNAKEFVEAARFQFDRHFSERDFARWTLTKK